jgi:hypothetical protein
MVRKTLLVLVVTVATGCRSVPTPLAPAEELARRHAAPSPTETAVEGHPFPTLAAPASDDIGAWGWDASDRPPAVTVVGIGGTDTEVHCDDYSDPGPSGTPAGTPVVPGEDIALGPSVHWRRIWDGEFADVDGASPLGIRFASPAPVTATLDLLAWRVDSPPVARLALSAPRAIERWDLSAVPAGEYRLGLRARWSMPRMEAECGLPVRISR